MLLSYFCNKLFRYSPVLFLCALIISVLRNKSLIVFEMCEGGIESEYLLLMESKPLTPVTSFSLYPLGIY